MHFGSSLQTNYAYITIGRITLLFSYGTLVGVQYPGAFLRSSHTPTTTKHQYKAGFGTAAVVSQEELERQAAMALALQGVEHVQQRIEGEEK